MGISSFIATIALVATTAVAPPRRLTCVRWNWERAAIRL